MSFGSDFLDALSTAYRTGIITDFLSEKISTHATWTSLTKSSAIDQVRDKKEWLSFVAESRNFKNYDNAKGFHNYRILYENKDIVVWHGWDDVDAWLAFYEIKNKKIVKAVHARGRK